MMFSAAGSGIKLYCLLIRSSVYEVKPGGWGGGGWNRNTTSLTWIPPFHSDPPQPPRAVNAAAGCSRAHFFQNKIHQWKLETVSIAVWNFFNPVNPTTHKKELRGGEGNWHFFKLFKKIHTEKNTTQFLRDITSVIYYMLGYLVCFSSQQCRNIDKNFGGKYNLI